MPLKMLYILTVVIFSKLSLASHNITVEDFSGVRDQEYLYPCESDVECELLNSSKCKEGFCFCPENTDCPKIVKGITIATTLNEKCGESIRCFIPYAHCNNGTCVCYEGFVESLSKKTCFQGDKKVGEECFEDKQCLSLHCHENRCFRHVALGKKCRNTKECTSSIAFSHCKDGKCDCLERYVANEGKCYLISRDLLSPCEVDAQCVEILGKAAKCVEAKCVCPEGYTYESLAKRCVLNVVGSSASYRFTFKMIVCGLFFVKILY